MFVSVKPYTRHQSSCQHKSTKHNACHCPKWPYVRQKGAKARRYSFSTPSWAEAMAEATKLLEGMNPEVAAARQQKAEHEGTLRQYRSLEPWQGGVGAQGIHRPKILCRVVQVVEAVELDRAAAVGCNPVVLRLSERAGHHSGESCGIHQGTGKVSRLPERPVHGSDHMTASSRLFRCSTTASSARGSMCSRVA